MPVEESILEGQSFLTLTSTFYTTFAKRVR